MKFKRYTTTFAVILTYLCINAEQRLDTLFANPVRHQIFLAGSFGELRSSHFHAGLDIKPIENNREGEDILAAADGYISRIKVDRSGYGKCIYIDHPNGYTTVYAHLSKFEGALDDYVKQIQFKANSYEFEVYPEAASLTIVKGQVIGKLGNSGQSYGAHLHFEIRDTKTETPINPMLFGIKPTDHVAPTIETCIIHELDQNKHKISEKKIKLLKTKTGDYQDIEVEAGSDHVGLALYTYDKMDGAPNKNGIYQLKMFEDDILVYQFTLNKVSFDESHLIDVHTDYETKFKEDKSETLCYQLPSNQLAIIDSVVNHGIVELGTNKEKNIKIEVSDIDGNASILKIRIKRNNIQNPSPSLVFQKWLKFNTVDTFSVSGVNFIIPNNSIPYDMPFNLNLKDSINKVIYEVGDPNIPVLQKIKMILKKDTNDAKILVHIDKKSKMTVPTFIKYDSMYQADISAFGMYMFFLDTIAPMIDPINFQIRPVGKSLFTFSLKDNLKTKSDILELKYNVWIDQEWYPCEYKSVSESLYVPIMSVAGEHLIRIEASDFSGNKKEWQGIYSIQ